MIWTRKEPHRPDYGRIWQLEEELDLPHSVPKPVRVPARGRFTALEFAEHPYLADMP